MPSRALRVALPVAATLLLVTAGCGQQAADTPRAATTKKVDEATSGCRAKWADLGAEVEGAESRTEPSALPERWNAVVATIDYYATSAKESDCGDALTGQQSAIDALTGLGAKLRPYDMEYRFAQVRTDAEAYAAGPRPATPRSKKDKQQPAPQPKDVGAAVKTLTAKAPAATQEQLPAWEQARVVEITDAAAVKKAVKDLAFLSSESASYAACTQALATIRKALAAKK